MTFLIAGYRTVPPAAPDSDSFIAVNDYWSSTSITDFPDVPPFIFPRSAWRVDFIYGFVTFVDESLPLYVRAVRSAQ